MKITGEEGREKSTFHYKTSTSIPLSSDNPKWLGKRLKIPTLSQPEMYVNMYIGETIIRMVIMFCNSYLCSLVLNIYASEKV